ncbi:hypothetical protein [Hyphococcus sp.]|uniref:hypothetical protein n=1 Tax=Hyphococcus sp. TaxID=2038636 RepID=UPI00208196DE|nr:MAG: hypothetical protein DHS20C04_30810 [Marinicaulis sp.]
MAEDVLYTVYQGDCLKFDVDPRDEDDLPFDFTGADVAVTLTWPGGSWSDDLAGGVTVTDGVITAEIPSATTALLPVGRRARLHVAIIDSGGCPLTVIAGRLRVLRKGL